MPQICIWIARSPALAGGLGRSTRAASLLARSLLRLPAAARLPSPRCSKFVRHAPPLDDAVAVDAASNRRTLVTVCSQLGALVSRGVDVEAREVAHSGASRIETPLRYHETWRLWDASEGPRPRASDTNGVGCSSWLLEYLTVATDQLPPPLKYVCLVVKYPPKFYSCAIGITTSGI